MTTQTKDQETTRKHGNGEDCRKVETQLGRTYYCALPGGENRNDPCNTCPHRRGQAQTQTPTQEQKATKARAAAKRTRAAAKAANAAARAAEALAALLEAAEPPTDADWQAYHEDMRTDPYRAGHTPPPYTEEDTAAAEEAAQRWQQWLRRDTDAQERRALIAANGGTDPDDLTATDRAAANAPAHLAERKARRRNAWNATGRQAERRAALQELTAADHRRNANAPQSRLAIAEGEPRGYAPCSPGHCRHC